MPTAAKLFAAFGFALMAFFAGQIVKSHFPPEQNLGYVAEICAIIGFVCGWLVMGPSVGKGFYQAFGKGMKTGVVTAAWALFGFSCYRMAVETLRNRYDGPMEAVVNIAGFFVDLGGYLLFPDMIAIVLIGGGLAGALAEWAGKRWP